MTDKDWWAICKWLKQEKKQLIIPLKKPFYLRDKVD